MAIQIKTFALALAIVAGVLGCAAHAPQPASTPVPASISVQQADARLAEAGLGRAAAEARFAQREQICYAQFFVNQCLDRAKEERRAALAGWRAIEIEASHFKRVDAVEQRDLALAEANAKADAQPAAARPVKEVSPPGPAPRARAVRQAQPEALNDDAKRAANAAAYQKKRTASLQRQREIAAKKAAREASDAAKKAAPPAPGTGAP